MFLYICSYIFIIFFISSFSSNIFQTHFIRIITYESYDFSLLQDVHSCNYCEQFTKHLISLSKPIDIYSDDEVNIESENHQQEIVTENNTYPNFLLVNINAVPKV